MARYGDLYTPASNYGQVYRGGLRQRTEAQEKAGQNMVDFAGDIYNLVDRQRQRKMEEREAQSREAERASLQNSRQFRDQLAAEQQGFNLYSQKLRNAVTLYKDEEDRLDSRRYKRYGGREQTSKAFDERYEKFTTAMSAAMTDPQAQRAVLHEFRDLIPEFQGAEGIDVLDDKVVANEKLNTYRPMSKELFMEKELDKSVGGNQFRDLIRSLLMHPTYGVPYAVEESEKTLMDSRPVTKQEQLDTEKLSRNQTTVAEPEAANSEITSELDFAAREGSKLDGDKSGSEETITEEEEVEPGFVFQDLPFEGLEETLEKADSKYKWLSSTSDKRFQAVDQMFSIIGFYLQSKGEPDTPDARIAEFQKMPATRGELADVNSKPEKILSEFKNHKGFKDINPDNKQELESMMDKLRRILVGLNIESANKNNIYGNKEFFEDAREIKDAVFPEQKSRKRRPQRNSSLD